LLALTKQIKVLSTEVTERFDNFTIFSALELDKISSGFKETKHGLFSYYLMKGLNCCFSFFDLSITFVNIKI